MGMLSLPRDLQERIVSLLDWKSISACNRACKALHAALPGNALSVVEEALRIRAQGALEGQPSWTCGELLWRECLQQFPRQVIAAGRHHSAIIDDGRLLICGCEEQVYSGLLGLADLS